ncbi:MAG: glycosyltransferase family 4 protein [Dyadobacter fermentans]
MHQVVVSRENDNLNMHILLIHQYFLEDNAAGGSRWNEMARIWVEEGHAVTVIAGDIHYMHETGAGERRERFAVGVNGEGVTVIRCKLPRNYHSGFRGRFWGYVFFAIAAVYAGLRRAVSVYDCIIATSPPLFAGIPELILSKWKRIPFVFEIRDLWPESAVEMGIVRNRMLIRLAVGFEKYLYRKAAQIIVLTPAFREKLIRTKGVKREKIVLIPNAADFRWSEQALASSAPAALRAKLGLEGKFVIIYVGAHGLANDLIQLVHAAALLGDTDAHFLLVGDGMQKQMLMDKVAALGLHNVSFLDPVPKEEIFHYIIMADVGAAVLKKAEVFKTIYSNKTFDYLSCKKPVLMAIDGISRTLIEQAAAGLFAEPGNAVDFADKVRIYMNDRALLRKHGENGHDFVRRNFDRGVLAKDLLKALQKMRASNCKTDRFVS